MKLLTFFMLIAVTSVAAESYSQPVSLTFSLANVTVSRVFREIERKSDYILIYNEKSLDINRKVSIKSDNESVETILNQVFAGTKNGYKISGRQIVITEQNEAIPEIDTSAYATALQQVNVTGTVTDQKGVPLIGVTVSVKGTNTGGNTNAAGFYSLNNVPNNAVLVFTFIGMIPQEVPLNGQIRIDIVMKEKTVGLEEVVVVGYGVQKKETLVGAVTQINSAAILRSGVQTITNAIAGKLSGILTIQNTGQPGADQSEIIIRGLSSWNGSEPLVLVDGVERDFKDLDPNEISTISVLKDASATAVYGSKGANGVIIVTSKRGTLGKPVLSFSAEYGVKAMARTPIYVNAYTTMSMLNVAMKNEGRFTDLISQNALEEYRNPSTPLNSIRYPDNDWFSLLMRPFAPTFTSNINVSGGTSFVKYFCSLGYLTQEDNFKAFKDKYFDSRFKFNRFNYRTNVDFTLTKTTQLSVSVGGEVGITNTPNQYAGTNALWGAMYGTSSCRYPAYYPAWVLEQVPDTDYPDANGDRNALAPGEYFLNPYNCRINASFNEMTGSKLFTDLVLDQKLDHILKGLSFKAKFALSTYYENQSLSGRYTYTSVIRSMNESQYQVDFNKIGTSQNPWTRDYQTNEVFYDVPININVGGLQSNFYHDLYYETGLYYINAFGNHNFTGMALLNRQQKNKVVDFPYYNEALVGRATYDYLRKYLLEVNVGYTGSEQFAPGNRFGFFPSAAIGWVISEESFIKNTLPWMNRLKIRYSDGLVGSDKAASRWLYTNDYTAGTYITESKLPNTNAQWEEARKKDIGLEVGIFQNLFTFSIDFFDEYRDKMLLTPRSVTFFVANSFKDLNLGKLKKHGFEVEAEFNKTTASNLKYFVKAIFAYNENRIIFKDDPLYAPEYSKDSGKPLGGVMNGVITTGTGYFTSVDDIHTSASPLSIERLVIGDYKYLDYKADGSISGLDKYAIKGSKYPPVVYSLSGGLSYKGFDFNILWQGNLGKYTGFNIAFENEFNKGVWRVHEAQLDYWTPANQGANHTTLHYQTAGMPNLTWAGGEGAAYGYDVSLENRLWRNCDYLRLKEIYIGYTFSPGFLKRMAGVSNLVVYATGNNLLTFTKLIEGDPENKDLFRGDYPQLLQVNLGLKVAF